jgi:hypothetical protein
METFVFIGIMLAVSLLASPMPFFKYTYDWIESPAIMQRGWTKLSAAKAENEQDKSRNNRAFFTAELSLPRGLVPIKP